jgi:hypothetical protein
MNAPVAISLVQQLAVEKAVKFLTASKVPFAIEMPDGTFLGDLKVMPKVTRLKQNNWRIIMPGYIEKIEAMQVGDVVMWQVENIETVERFRSAVSGQGNRSFGSGAFMTAVKDSSIEAMRLE